MNHKKKQLKDLHVNLKIPLLKDETHKIIYPHSLLYGAYSKLRPAE